MAREVEAVASRRRALGECLATFRRVARLTQAQLAALVICDRTTVAHVEKGRSRADERFWSAADEACRAHGALVAAFREFESVRLDHQRRATERELAEMRVRASLVQRQGDAEPGAAVRVEGHPATLDAVRQVVLGRGADVEVAERLTVAAARARTHEAHRLYQTADYDGAAALLPGVLSATERLAGGDDRQITLIAVTAYLAAAKLATKQADAGLAWVTADRALRLASETGLRCLAPLAGYQVACALLHAGHVADAERVAADAAEDIGGHIGTLGRSGRWYAALSVHGALVLLSALLAARRGDEAGAGRQLTVARQLAEELGEDGNWLWTGFGPTNVAIHEVAVRVDLGDAGQAMRIGASVDTDRLPSVLLGRRSQVHLDLARAAVQRDDDTLAVLHLLESERVAAQAVSRNAAARSLVGTLLARERAGATPGLRALAARAEVLR